MGLEGVALIRVLELGALGAHPELPVRRRHLDTEEVEEGVVLMLLAGLERVVILKFSIGNEITISGCHVMLFGLC